MEQQNLQNLQQPQLDEETAQSMAEELVKMQESASGDGSKRKQSRAALCEWMVSNERPEIDVGVGTAVIKETTQPIKHTDLLAFTLKDEPYNWTDQEIDDLVQSMDDTKDRIAEPKFVLRIKLKRKKKTKGASVKRSRANEEEEEDNDGEEEAVVLDDIKEPVVDQQVDNKTHSPKKSEKKRASKKTLVELLKTKPPPVYAHEMDVTDIEQGRTKPDYRLVDAFGPIKTRH
jgi:hypothetical protein